MKHMSTWDLLDLAEEVKVLSKKYIFTNRSLIAESKLASIDTELLSRMPEYSYVTVLDDSGNPVGFEPYIREDNTICNHEWIERYFGFVCGKCGAMKPVDEWRL